MKKFRDIVSKDKVSGFEASARNSIANRKQLDEEFELKLKKLTEEKIMKKQTAVQWLVDEIAEKYNFRFATYYGQHIQEALEMEKEQIIDAYDTGFTDAWSITKDNNEPKHEGAEQYYKQTYED
jgi:hypothetical protein